MKIKQNKPNNKNQTNKQPNKQTKNNKNKNKMNNNNSKSKQKSYFLRSRFATNNMFISKYRLW